MIRGMFIIAALAVLAGPSGAAHADCKASDFSAVVDQSGASLRAFTLQEQPKVQEKMRRYKEVRKLSEEEYQDVAFEAIQDAKLVELDQTSGDLLLKVDTLGRVPEGTAPDCSKLDEIKAASNALLSVMKAKSDYILQRLDAKIAEASAQSPPAKPAAQPDKRSAEAAKTQPDAAKPQAAQTSQAAPASKNPQPKPANGPEWSPMTKPNDAYSPPAAPEAPAPKVAAVDPQQSPSEPDGYTIDEIREATRGFFGGLSTNLASVIEHAFKESGRPSGYVLGTEGGGAFLAGLRFGEGTLFMRERQESLPVFWHGPSLGSDFGASGSRTLFLIYHLRDAEALFRNFAGVDGSAYVVGGVGLTILKGGDVIMAPIRTGLGLRVGANVGYIRFTRKATWNPF
jgi:hypothetical protein